MFYKPTTRLVAVKFLGLFGAGQIYGDNKEQKINQQERLDLVGHLTDKEKLLSRNSDNTEAIDASTKKIVGLLLEKGVPGLTVAVSKEGKNLWTAAFGFCDVENQLECEPDAKMRIASISKAIFAATVVGPLIEQNNLDLKSSIHKYITHEEFPIKSYNGEKSDITIKQLLSHTSGIRDYNSTGTTLKPIGSLGSMRIFQCDDQYNGEHFYQKRKFRSVIDALEAFKNDPLASKPGNYSYSTYGYTLLSAVIEKVHQQSDERHKNEQIEDFWVKTLTRNWGMTETSLDQSEPILSKRARYYLRTGQNGGLINAPPVDLSVKWAGGGIISTVSDLLKFANHLIDSYKGRENSKLKRETIELLWREVTNAYGLGFEIKQLQSVDGDKITVGHSGGAVGASSILIIFPESEVAVAILANLGSVNLNNLGVFIGEQFAKNK